MSEADISTDSLEDCQDLKSGVSMADSSTACAEESMQDEDDDENDENALVVVMPEAEEDTNDEDGDHSGEGKDNDEDDDNEESDDDSDSKDDEGDTKDDEGESKDEGDESRDDVGSNDGETAVRTCKERVLRTQQGEDRDPDQPVSLGFSDALDEMLLQHGEFPASPLLASSLRYRNTSLDALLDFRSHTRQPASRAGAAAATTHDHRLGFKEEQSPPSVLSWRTGEGGECLWSPSTSASFASSRAAARNVDNSHTPGPACFLGARCLLPGEHHSPPPAHQAAGSFPACRYSRQPPAYNWHLPPAPWQPTTAPWQPTTVPWQPTTVPWQPPTAHWQPPVPQWQPPTAHQQPPTAHWQPPSVHHKSDGRRSPKLDAADVEGNSSEADGRKCSPRRAMINEVMLNNTRAFRSHPLYPLLHDLAVIDHYFNKAAFNLGPLLSFLPSTTEEMVTLYLRSNPHVALNFSEDTQSLAVDAVVLDAVTYTHHSLLEKVTFKSSQEATRMRERAAKVGRGRRGVEEIRDRYMDVLRSSKPLRRAWLGDCTAPTTTTTTTLTTTTTGRTRAEGAHYTESDDKTFLDSLHLDSLPAPLSPIPDTNPAPSTLHSVSATSCIPQLCSTASLSVTLTLTVSTTTTTTTTTTAADNAVTAPYPADARRRMPNTHHSREAREVLRAWLKEHQHYPYPDDDQKAALVRLTGLTVQQVTRWLSNARRRHLPRLKADRGTQ